MHFECKLSCFNYEAFALPFLSVFSSCPPLASDKMIVAYSIWSNTRVSPGFTSSKKMASDCK